MTAEKEVLAADCFDRVTVYRPSIIVGDSQTGYTTSYHGFYTPLRVAHSLLQTFSPESIFNGDFLGGIELDGHERKNLVPVEWVSAAIGWLVTHQELPRPHLSPDESEADDRAGHAKWPFPKFWPSWCIPAS